jgi:hypothetical protein
MITCRECKFWKRAPDNDYQTSPRNKGTCRAHPPVWLVVADSAATCFPVTHEGDWCGEGRSNHGCSN